VPAFGRSSAFATFSQVVKNSPAAGRNRVMSQGPATVPLIESGLDRPSSVDLDLALAGHRAKDTGGERVPKQHTLKPCVAVLCTETHENRHRTRITLEDITAECADSTTALG